LVTFAAMAKVTREKADKLSRNFFN